MPCDKGESLSFVYWTLLWIDRYYFAFVPAMSYFRTNELRREEEGPAIASIYPIVHTEYLLLSRDLSDTDGDGVCFVNILLLTIVDNAVGPVLLGACTLFQAHAYTSLHTCIRPSIINTCVQTDISLTAWLTHTPANTHARKTGHQRACLHAVIDVPHWGGLVDVFTVHLSLSERARDRSVREIWNMAANTSVVINTHYLNLCRKLYACFLGTSLACIGDVCCFGATFSRHFLIHPVPDMLWQSVTEPE